MIAKISSNTMEFAVIQSWTNLLKHNIYSSHILPPKRMKIMTCSNSHMCMHSSVFNYMTNIFHTMLTTPISNLFTEVLSI